MSKGFAGIYLLIGALILAALVGAIYFGKLPVQIPFSQPQTSVSPTPQVQEVDEMANWKTYINNNYKFSFKYPVSWEVKDITNEPVGTGFGPDGKNTYKPLNDFLKDAHNNEVVFILTLIAHDAKPEFNSIVPKKGPGGFWISGIRLEIKRGTKGDLESYKENIEKVENKRLLGTDKKATAKIENISINDQEVIKFSWFRIAMGMSEHKSFSEAIFYRDGFIYKLSNNIPGVGHSDAYFDQILSTFKFN